MSDRNFIVWFLLEAGTNDKDETMLKLRWLGYGFAGNKDARCNYLIYM